ncbi:hypothetical protein ARMGADRAFT_1036499 [Armillaria gallica]|uniref:Uncharacterized protein n=1 Tax=Armillaria gallica TaxID=47427 RepID=A0A2H3CUT1_ARMGA|nr:hypothetical protein ARMGADRAFT_1036499 [Armillaria gallica]
MFFHAFTALLAATAVASSPLTARGWWSKMYHHLVTPKDLSYAAGVANQLTYDNQPIPKGTSVTSISIIPVQHRSCTADALDVAHIWSISLSVMSLTLDQITMIIKEQWLKTWV